jgi:hypothetical protein
MTVKQKRKSKKVKTFNCSPKLNKPVIVPTRYEILPILDELREDVVNHFLLPEELVEIVAHFIGDRFNVDVKHAESAQVDQNDIDFNSYYDGGLDEVNEVPIEIYMITNPMQDIMVIDDVTFDAIIRRIADSLAHEVIHMQQYRARDFLELNIVTPDELSDEEETQLYLSDPDEINAYAHNIANELLEHGDVATVKHKLNNLKDITLKDSLNLWAYVNTFAKDTSHPVIKRLLKKVYQNLMYIGRHR